MSLDTTAVFFKFPVILLKEGEELDVDEFLTGLTEIAKKEIVEAKGVEVTGTHAMILRLFQQILPTWFDADSFLYIATSNNKRHGFLGALATAYLAGLWVGQNKVQVKPGKIDEKSPDSNSQ